jgi:hypothetical protein
VAGKHRDDEPSGFVDDDHRRVAFLAAEVRRDQADDGAERDDGDDRVDRGEPGRHLIADLAGVAPGGVWRCGLGFRAEFLRREQAGAG